ncbi:MAG: hypothetical protein ACFFB3_13435 [Candidatus Hodarchaeota archaeon]
MRLQEITPSMIVLLVGGILAIVVQLPIINEILPLVSYSSYNDPTFGEIEADGGANLLGGFGEVTIDFGDPLGEITADIESVDGWTFLGLAGGLFWILILAGAVLCIIPAINKYQAFLPEMEMAIPGGLPFLLAIIGSVLQLLIVLLIFIGDAEDEDKYGLSLMDTPAGVDVGFGFYVMAIAAILSLIGAILLYLEETSA